MTRGSIGRTACLAMLVGGLTWPVAAQTPVQPQPPAPNMPSPQATPPEKIDGGTRPTLSEKLNQTDGVIRPPAGMDSQMPVKPPVAEPNSTPVITPPGAPGGNQTIQPI